MGVVMKIAMFSTKPYDRTYFEQANHDRRHEITYFELRLSRETVGLAAGYDAVCAFVNDVLDAGTLATLHRTGTRWIALRCAGFNQVDLAEAERLGMKVVRVPAYSPHAVAEHTVALMLSLDRKIHRAYARVREGNFALNGLIGFDLYGKTVGIIGTGKIGEVLAAILKGFGCRLLGYDLHPSAKCVELGMQYVSMEQLLAESDVVSLHCPLTPTTRHLINAEAIERMKPGVMLINTSRGAVVDTPAVIEGLKSGRIGYLGLDVYEEEADYFFEDLSDAGIADDVLARLLTFPNVLVTGHQAFLTHEALSEIAGTTLSNLDALEQTGVCQNEVKR